MNVFQLARQSLTALRGEYLLTLPEDDRAGIARVPKMSREALVAAIAGDPDRGRRLRAMAAAERRAGRWSGGRDERHAA